MDITPTADDKGIQRLRLEQQDKTIKPSRQVEAYPRIPDSAHQQPSPLPPHAERRMEDERRKEERRKGQNPQHFDTRSKEERRQRARRTGDVAEQTATRHIDECI